MSPCCRIQTVSDRLVEGDRDHAVVDGRLLERRKPRVCRDFESHRWTMPFAQFLAEAADEGLTKGTERPRRETIRKHVGAFANTEGDRELTRVPALVFPLQLFPIYENIAKIPIQEGGGDGRSDDRR